MSPSNLVLTFLLFRVIPKIREKIDSVLEGRMMDHDDIKSLPYLQAVFYEATRLHSAGECSREAEDRLLFRWRCLFSPFLGVDYFN